MNELAPSLVGWCEGRVGATLCDKWRLDRLIDVGGMAAVYSATHRNGNRVAIKMLHPDAALVPGVRERFLKEGYVANHIGHPGAVRVLDDDVADDGAVFLVMELLEGETLQARIDRRGGRLPPDDVLCIVDRVLDVLCAAHDRGILHRDLKPANIFITLGGEVKLLDFGIARLREETDGIPFATVPGMVLGTPGFLPPEQALGRVDVIDARSDLWAAGATMYSALSGRSVHEAETSSEQVVLAATQPVPSLETVAPRLPGPLVDLVDRALGYRMEERWQSAAEMRTAVREVFHRIAGFGISRVDDVAVAVEPRQAALLGAAVTQLSAGTPPHRLPPPTHPGGSPAPSLTLHGSVRSTGLRLRLAAASARSVQLLRGPVGSRGPAVALAAAVVICAAALLAAVLRTGSVAEPVAPPAEAPVVPASALLDSAAAESPPPAPEPRPPPPESVSPAPESVPPLPESVPPLPESVPFAAPPAPPAPRPAAPAPRRRDDGRTGALNIDSAPAAQVLLDGRPLGSTPKVNVRVTPGIHQITFVHKLFPKKTVTLHVPAGAVKRASVTLTRSKAPAKK